MKAATWLSLSTRNGRTRSGFGIDASLISSRRWTPPWLRSAVRRWEIPSDAVGSVVAEVGKIRRALLIQRAARQIHIRLLDDASVDRADYVYPPGELPEPCQRIDRFVSSGVVQDYARQLGPVSGGLYVANTGVLVFQVTDDPTSHRQALETDGAQACVVQVQWSEAELHQIKTALEPQLASLVPYAAATSSGTVGRVEVGVPVADGDTVRKIAALVEEPETLRVIGQAIILNR